MNVFVASYGFQIGSPNIFETLEAAKKFAEDRQSEDKWVWYFFEDEESWYFAPADDDAPEEIWIVSEVEVK